MSRTLGVIPARLNSSRLPGKLLMRVGGKTILQRTYEQAMQAESLDRVVIASGDPEIIREAMRFGCETAVFTDESKEPIHSGTMRVRFVSRMPQFEDYDIFVNIQADEPEVRPGDLDLLVAKMKCNDAFNIRTLVSDVNADEINSKSVVKVYQTPPGRPLFYRQAGDIVPLKHIGIYAFRKIALYYCRSEGPVDLEQEFFGGQNIDLVQVERVQNGINTAEDFSEFEKRFNAAEDFSRRVRERLARHLDWMTAPEVGI